MYTFSALSCQKGEQVPSRIVSQRPPEVFIPFVEAEYYAAPIIAGASKQKVKRFSSRSPTGFCYPIIPDDSRFKTDSAGNDLDHLLESFERVGDQQVFAPSGTYVFSVVGGRVIGLDKDAGSVEILEGEFERPSYFTMYSGLKKISVHKGDNIKCGQLLGSSGLENFVDFVREKRVSFITIDRVEAYNGE
jgi:murein DD-endopeptidase MepM/ murein hydrolase activator NlpD